MNTESLNGKFEMVDVSSIVIGVRSRDVNPVQVDALAETFKTAEMLNPITIWQSEDGPYLVAGAHRLAAHKKNGSKQIQAKWLDVKTLAEVKVFEVIENLGRHDLTVLDRAHHLYDWKQVYETQHPETKHGAQGGRGAQKNEGVNNSFSKYAAKNTGFSTSKVKKYVAIWKGLSRDTIVDLEGTYLVDHNAHLTLLSQQNPRMQNRILKTIFPVTGDRPLATNVPDALKIITDGPLMTAVGKKTHGLKITLSSFKDGAFHSVMSHNQKRVRAWVEANPVLGAQTKK